MQSASPTPTIRVDPELARVTVGLYKASPFRVWIIARSLTRRADGSGNIAKKALISALSAHDVRYTRQHINRLIAAGDGLFWNVGDKRLFIRSSQYVSQQLTLKALETSPALVANNRPGTRDMYVTTSGSLADWESHLYAAWMSSRNNPTISRDRLSVLFNRTDETLRQWEERRTEQLKVRTNYAHGNSEIYVMDVDGSNPVRLTYNGDNDTRPRWSPDGSKIVFFASRDGDHEIYVLNIANCVQGSNCPTVQLTSNEEITDWLPDWHGSKIVWSQWPFCYPSGDCPSNLWVMNDDGSGKQKLTNANQSWQANWYPRWSPDGNWIAYITQISESDVGNDVAKCSFPNCAVTRLTSTAGNDGFPAWSPDGSQIAFISQRNGAAGLYLMNADGTNQTRIMSDNFITSLDWGPMNPEPNVVTLADYGVTADGWTAAEESIILQALEDTAQALHSISQNNATLEPYEVFFNVMVSGASNLQIVKDPNVGGICVTDNNLRKIRCDDQLIAPDGITNLSFTKYVLVHELGHVFDNRAATGGQLRLVDMMATSIVIRDCGIALDRGPARVMGEIAVTSVEAYLKDRERWTRGERGWGSGPARVPGALPFDLNGSTLRLVTDYQQNAVLIDMQQTPGRVEYNALSNPPADGEDTAEAKLVRVEEAAADMFLNWVYRRNALLIQNPGNPDAAKLDYSDPTLLTTPRYCTQDLNWSGPGFKNESWAIDFQPLNTPIADPSNSGDARYAWMDSTVRRIFSNHINQGW